MPINVLMPALSPTMEKGNLAKWLKKEGDKIKSGDVLAEIETDKATMEVEAVDEGVLAKILVPAGSVDVPVNNVIAVIAGEGEDAKAVTAAAKSAAPSTQGTPAPKPTAAAAPANGAPPQPMQTDAGPRLFATPLARRLAQDGGIDISKIAGSGPNGRIVERDVKAALSGQGARTPSSLPPSLGVAAARSAFGPSGFREVALDGMRKTIARRLTQAQTIPQFYLTVDCEIDALLKLREDINKAALKSKDGAPTFKVSVNDMLIKALAMALVDVPGANVTYTESAMLHHEHADVAVAVAIPEGLITPIVRSADLLPLTTISAAMKDFAARAKERRLKPQEYEGGVSAISNLGMYGIKNFSAVLNPPQSSIVAVGLGEERAVVRDGKLTVATIMSATLTCDHRALDGAKGAELIAAFKRYIENPVAMLI